MRSILILILVMLCGTAVAKSEFRIFSTASGKEVDLRQMAQSLAKHELIFFGEYHDNDTIHQLQAEILPLLYAQNKTLILSFEMFERDVAPILDLYLQGKVSEADFLKQSRPWGNYDPDYKNLIEFAKTHSLKVVAANVPRYLAGKAVRSEGDFLASLTEEEKSWTASRITAPDDDYQKRFIATISAGGAHGMTSDKGFLDRLYYAQCLKDDTMAEAIVKEILAEPKATIIHFNGDFHSRAYLGTVQRVKVRLPKIKTAVISPEFGDINHPQLTPEHKNEADFIIFIPQIPEEQQ